MKLSEDKIIKKKCKECESYLLWIDEGKKPDTECERRLLTNTEFMCRECY